MLRTSSIGGRLVAASVIALGVVACYSLEDETSFPCATDGSCPDPEGGPTWTCFMGRCRKASTNCSASENALGNSSLDNRACAPTCFNGQCPLGLKCDQSYRGYSTSAIATCVECVTADDCPEKCCNLGRCVTQIVAKRQGFTTQCLGSTGTPTSALCDVVAQDCIGKKCVISQTAGAYENRCVDDKGTKKLDEECTRVSFGDDDCAKGLTCSPRPLGSNHPPHCRRLCNVDSDCAGITNGACFIIAQPNASFRGGICSPTCNPFESNCVAGSACAAAADPAGKRVSTYCGSAVTPSPDAGTRAEGTACTTLDQCLPGLTCRDVERGTAYKCMRWCDLAHPCPNEKACIPYDNANGLGTCAL